MKSILIAGVIMMALHTNAIAQDTYAIDRTESPCFFISTDKSEVERLPLKSTTVTVNISAVIADVVVKQVYRNEGIIPLEAVYVFPGSTRAAVYGMKMKVGERTIIAQIEEKEKARHGYDQAKQSGQRASLLEQHRPNVFQMNVANIMPGDEIEVELSYTELLVPEEGIYEFAFPTVVGPRYSNPAAELASVNESWALNPYLKEGELPMALFYLSVSLDAGMPVQKVICTSHETNIRFQGKERVNITLSEAEKPGGNRDFILKYELKGRQIQPGLLLYEGAQENFFLLMVQPPRQVISELVPPREYVFIVDISGSMYGFPLETSKTLMRDLLGNLRPVDKFNVLLFAGSSSVFSERSVDANHANIRNAIEFVEKQRGGGGTELLPALQRALALKGTESHSRTFVIATDGYVTVEKEVFDLIRENLGNANFFTFGIGTSVNRHLIEGMAYVGKGIPFIAARKEEAGSLADKFRKYISSPVLTNIRIHVEGFDIYDVEPLEIPDLFSERPLMIYGKYRGTPKGAIEITGKTGDGDYLKKVNIAEGIPQSTNNALRQLWARERIRLLSDYSNLVFNSSLTGEITALGLKYNLLTSYTSFLAIDSEVVNKEGSRITVIQPLPLPKVVSGFATGSVANRADLMNYGGLYQNEVSAPIDKRVKYTLDEDLFPDDAELFTFSGNTKPEFEGGELALHKFIKDKLTYPEKAKQEKITGTVYLELVIDSKGKIDKVIIIKGSHRLLDEEALRVLKLTDGKWKPAVHNKIPVSGSVIILIRFSI